MEKNIRKKLARNWFLTIQELICHEIENIENGTSYFKTACPKNTTLKFNVFII